MRILALLFLLAACAKAPTAQTDAVSSVATPASASLAQTENLGTSEAIRAASVAALAGPGSLPASIALRCWRREVLRPQVRQACLLAWSAAGQDSPELNEALRSSFRSDRVVALAAARREGFAQTLSEAEMLSLEASLSAEAPWIRARVVLEWLRVNKPASYIEADKILTAVHLPEKGSSPITFASRFAVSSGLGQAKEAGWLRFDYCVPGSSGYAITRCLRALSALSAPRYGDSARELVRANLPPRKDPGTIFFQRSFPSRAHDFDNLY
jgi:hypothetical protein